MKADDEEKNKLIAALRAEVVGRDRCIEALEGEVTAAIAGNCRSFLNSRIHALKADDEEKNKLIAALRAEVVGREGECARIAAKLKEAQSEVEEQEHAIARMEDAGLAVDAGNIQPRLVQLNRE